MQLLAKCIVDLPMLINKKIKKTQILVMNQIATLMKLHKKMKKNLKKIKKIKKIDLFGKPMHLYLQ